ncbi:surfeit locus 1 [Methylovorus sp. MP688]|nr:surfeit locus 1 [Methylovorus sp. MP688]
MQFPIKTRQRYRFSPRIPGALITLFCMAICIKLGLWQYDKAQQKQALQALYSQYLHAEPSPLPLQLNNAEVWRYRRVTVEGEYEPRYQVFLDNQVSHELAGYHVITPLRIHNTQQYVLVNRGWVPAMPEHRELPTIITPTGPQRVTGQVWVPSTRYYTLGKSDPKRWDAVWQNMDMQRYAALVPFAISPVIVRLDADSQAGGFDRDWPQPAERIGMHLSYAYQWFGFAFAALAIYVYLSIVPANSPTPPQEKSAS